MPSEDGLGSAVCVRVGLLWMRAPSGMLRGAGRHSRQKPALETWRRPAGSGESLARQSGLRRRPRAWALFSIHSSAMSERPASVYQPPTSEWTPANQTCSIVW